MFESDYDLLSLDLIEPAGRSFSMYVTPRFRDIYGAHGYERMTASFLARLLCNADLFIDVGAHYGYFSLLAASAHPNLPIVALEPMPANCNVLRRNVAHGGHRHIDVRQVAVSAGPGRKPGFVVSAASDNCSFCEHPNAPAIDRIEVEVVSIDALLAERDAKKIVLKIDTDGHELAVLAGMATSLRRDVDLRLVIELNPKMQIQAGSEPDLLLQELDRLGFAMFFIDDAGGRFFRLRPDGDWRTLMDPSSYANLYCVAKERALSVLFFSHSSQMAGAERSLIELADELVADFGAVCTVVAPGPGPLVESLLRSGVAILPADLPWWAFGGEPRPEEEFSKLARGAEVVCVDLIPLLAKIDPDVVFTQTMVIPWGALAASLLGKPHVWSICEYGDRDYGIRFVEDFDEIVAAIKSGSTLILTACAGIQKAMFSDVGPDRIRTIYRYIPMPDELAPSSAAWRRDSATKLGLFGSICEGKGQLDAVHAVAELVRRGHDVELLLAGSVSDESYHARLLSLIEAHKLNDRVILAGFLEDPFPAIAASDIVLACSRREAFGRNVLEAMLLERPIVYTRSGGFVEYMEDRTTGLAYAPGNIDELVRCIEEMIEDRPSARRMAQAARRSAQQQFSRDEYGGAVFRLLTRLRERKLPAVTVPHCVLVSMAAAIREEIAVLAQRDAERADLRRRLVATQAEMAEFHATIDALKASTSWQVTAPLRSIKRLFRPNPEHSGNR